MWGGEKGLQGAAAPSSQPSGCQGVVLGMRVLYGPAGVQEGPQQGCSTHSPLSSPWPLGACSSPIAFIVTRCREGRRSAWMCGLGHHRCVLRPDRRPQDRVWRGRSADMWDFPTEPSGDRVCAQVGFSGGISGTAMGLKAL